MNTWISFIAALDRNGVIGRDGGLPWHLPDDMRFFKRMTMGKPVIMGRKTFDSIGKPLPGRHNIVLTHNPNYQAPGCTVVYSVSEALAEAGEAQEIMIAGGAQIYSAFLPLANRMCLTLVDTEIEDGDAFLPAYDPNDWQETCREMHKADPYHAYEFVWVILERNQSHS